MEKRLTATVIICAVVFALLPANEYVGARNTGFILLSEGSALSPEGNLTLYETNQYDYNSPPFIIKTFRPLNITNIVDMAVRDGYIILIGRLEDSTGNRVWVLKLDSLGRVVWGRSYGLGYEDPAAVEMDHNGNTIVVGTIKLPYSSDSDVFVMKIDPDGNLLWENWYGWSDTNGRYNDSASDVAVDENNNIIVVGASKFGDEPCRALVIKVPSAGYGSNGFIKLYWIDGDDRTEASAVTVLPNGDFVVGGYRHYSVFLLGGRNAIWAMRFDASGNEMWDNIYNKAVSDDVSIGLRRMTNDGIWVYLVGYIYKVGEGYNGLAICINYDGSEAWSRDYDFENGDDGFNDVVYANNDLYVTGYSYKYGDTTQLRALILKLDDYGGDIIKGYYYYGTSGREGGLAVGNLTSDVIVFSGYYGDDVFVRWNSADDLVNVQTRFYTKQISLAQGLAMLPTGEIVVAGKSLSPGFDDFDGYIVKFNWWGNVALWSKHYGVPAFNETINDITATSNGTVFAVGVRRNWNMNMELGMILAINENGSLVWSRTIGNFGKDNKTSIVSLKETPNGNFIAAGYITDPSTGKKDALVLSFNTSGKIGWTKRYGGEDDDTAVDVAVTSQGDVIVLGSTNSFGGGYFSPAMWLIKIRNDGSVMWQKQYTADKTAIYPVSVHVMGNGDIAVLAEIYNFSSYNSAIGIIMLNSEGIVRECWIYDGDSNDVLGDYTPGGLTVTPGGDLVVAGHSPRNGTVIFRIDKQGNVLWARSYGLDGWGEKVETAQNGDIIVTGWTYQNGNAVPFLLRVPLNGNLANCSKCGEVNLKFHRITGIVGEDTSAVSEEAGVDVSGTSGTLRQIDIQQNFIYYNYRLKGDLDYDWKITSVDALLYLRYVVGLDITPYHIDPANDDLTGDGKITITDALKALRIAVGAEKPV